MIEAAARSLRADCIALALPSPLPGCLLVLARGQDLPEPPELVPVPAGNCFCDAVLQTGQELQAHHGAGSVWRDGRCGLMVAEELTSFLGVPVHSAGGDRVMASLSANSRMSRIWSRGDRELLRGIAREIGSRDLLEHVVANRQRTGSTVG
ncbi:GAF domain-containing protein [Poseidonocella sp. HB161398]|uniref:GAF domain-containing protein n=1 Tax=Poseidonocella sp. HB161398 TaxID=2320855 RepID=UPI001485DCB8|nr:GAF domain-containing protein [Poseidonocella sp. HB161398]